MGKAFVWTTAVWFNRGEATDAYEHFVELFYNVFNHPPNGRDAGDHLLTLKQKKSTATEFVLIFCIVAAGG